MSQPYDPPPPPPPVRPAGPPTSPPPPSSWSPAGTPPPPPGYGPGVGGPASPDGTSPGKGTKTGWLIAGAIAVLALVAGGVLAVTRGGDDEDADDTELTIPAGTLPGGVTVPAVSAPEFTIPDLTLPTPPSNPGGSTVTSGSPAGDVPPPAQEPTGLGSDPAMDALALACYDGDMQACDDLFRDSPLASAYETYGDTCAGRQPEGTGAYCVDTFGG